MADEAARGQLERQPLILKRAFDVIGACAGLLVFAPVMAIVIPAVLVDDGRPVLFRQPRLGHRRRPFSYHTTGTGNSF